MEMDRTFMSPRTEMIDGRKILSTGDPEQTRTIGKDRPRDGEGFQCTVQDRET